MKLKVFQMRFYNEIIILNKVNWRELDGNAAFPALFTQFVLRVGGGDGAVAEI